MGDDPPIPTAATFASNEEMVGWSPASLDRESLAVLARMNDRLAVHALVARAALIGSRTP